MNKTKRLNNIIALDFLEHMQSISNFEQWELDLITETIQVKKVKKGEVILPFGETSHFYFVNRGCLRTYYITENGSEFIRCFALEKSFCWAIPSFLNQQPSNESIEALCDSELIIISKKNFDTLNDKSSKFRNGYQKALEMLCMSYASRVESFLTMDAKLRYENLRAKNPSIIQKLPNKMVAAYLGIAQESLSRIKK
ncbi:MAG: Crp/Fnr family transcriptional regulator [Flavobacterium sp.]